MQPIRILVVDDEPDLAELVRQKFRRRVRAGEFELEFAADGEEALEQLDRHPDIDVMLTDLNMPRMDGLTLLGRVTGLERSLKAVVVTAYGDMENIRTAMNRGAFDFITKPIDLADLEITIEKAAAVVRRDKAAALARRAFDQYLSAEVADILLSDPAALRLGGAKRPVSILMSDLRGFSMVSERLPPERVVEVLNGYLGRMAEIIHDHGGTIIEFIGDAILAVFGAPIEREDTAGRAVAAALAMQRAMPAVNEQVMSIAGTAVSPLEMGIGVHTGDAIVGNIGSVTRTKYGVVGSHVNLTGRIESCTVGGQVLVSQATLEASSAPIETAGRVELSAKGFSETVILHDVRRISEPYDVVLDESESIWREVSPPFPISLCLLDGKQLSGETAAAEILALGSGRSRIRAEVQLAALANLRVILDQGIEGEVAFYAKVVSDATCAEVAELRFTAIPPEVAARLDGVAGHSASRDA
ncbi:hypothetical protein BH23BAC4_BH23BAC4_16600 [soil metagenome]